MQKKGCQCCGCLYVQSKDLDGYKQCLDCSWINDRQLNDDNQVSILNGYSIN